MLRNYNDVNETENEYHRDKLETEILNRFNLSEMEQELIYI